MFRTLKSIFIFLLIFFGILFSFLLIDENLYSCQNNCLAYSVLFAIFICVLFFGAFLNYKTLMICNDNVKDTSFLGDIKLPYEIGSLKKSKKHFLKSFIVNLIISLLTFLICFIMLKIFVETEVLFTNFYLKVIFGLSVFLISLLSFASLILDIKVRGKLKSIEYLS